MKLAAISICLLLCAESLANDYFAVAERARQASNWALALENYKLASENETHPIANYWIGTFYYEGIGVDRSATIAAAYFLLASNDGVTGSRVYLANMFLSGEGVQKDCERAEELVRSFSDEDLAPGWEKRLRACEADL